MTDKHYTIAPLAWEQPQLTWVAQSIFGEFYTASYDHIDAHQDRLRVWLVRLQDDTGYITTIASGCRSLEAAQIAAQQWYHDRLRPALKPVEVKDV